MMFLFGLILGVYLSVGFYYTNDFRKYCLDVGRPMAWFTWLYMPLGVPVVLGLGYIWVRILKQKL